MSKQNFKNIEQLGNKIARFFKATIIPEPNGFIVEKRDKEHNTYFRISLVYNFVNDESNVRFERGRLSDRKPYMRESINDIKNLHLTVPDGTEESSKNIVTFLYTHGDRFSIINVDTGMDLSRLCAFDKRKLQKDKPVPKEILQQRRNFEKIE